MSTSTEKDKRRGLPSRSRMADTPHGVHHQPRRKGNRKKLKSSVYFGTLLFLLRSSPDVFTREQQLWIVNYARKLSDLEILRAGRHAQKLLTKEDVRNYHLEDIVSVRRSIPWIEPYRAPESVRIGKGYTDKGALRPLHKKGRQLTDIQFWDEDIKYLLPFGYNTQGEWITADEVKSLVGIDLFHLVLNQIRSNSNTDQVLLPYLAVIQASPG